MIADYQLDQVKDNSRSIYDNDLDLKTFPELYPTGRNGMHGARETALLLSC